VGDNVEIIELLKAFILGVVQGVTEWLPISSTGHMIIVEDFLKFNLPEAFINTFFVVVQIGSVLAVVVLFFHQLNPFSRTKDKIERKETMHLWYKIIIATIPAVLIGYFFSEQIDKWLYNSVVVALALIIYGIIFIEQIRRTI
jgi:undecaprenyl-diphosphatase